jgi:hypothetical protein
MDLILYKVQQGLSIMQLERRQFTVKIFITADFMKKIIPNKDHRDLKRRLPQLHATLF